jgi:HK97 family phage major capsid protein
LISSRISGATSANSTSDSTNGGAASLPTTNTDDAMPAPTAGSYPVAFGNWARGYVLADRVGTMRITHDDNISAPGYHKFYMRRVVGGCVYNHESLKVAKLGIS